MHEYLIVYVYDVRETLRLNLNLGINAESCPSSVCLPLDYPDYQHGSTSHSDLSTKPAVLIRTPVWNQVQSCISVKLVSVIQDCSLISDPVLEILCCDYSLQITGSAVGSSGLLRSGWPVLVSGASLCAPLSASFV